jgi:divalent metal cation (Fe/Co/Zn/Cd) transporter
MSRQQHDLIVLIVQLVVGTAILFIAGNMAWNAVGPIIKQQMTKPANG